MIVDTLPNALPTDDNYGRNFIGGEWKFPAAPYEFEIRNPLDSTITTEVPLSSRIDVTRAIAAASDALHGPWRESQTRGRSLARLLQRCTELSSDLARLQCTESGLSWSDSTALLDATLKLARGRLAERVLGTPADQPPVVSGHVLSWGLPISEMLLSVFSALVDGHTVVVKPSLRGALTPDAIALIAGEVGFPPGVINIVQGTGVDVGAALISSPDLGRLCVHGNENTLARASRAYPFTHVPLTTLRGGGNAAMVFPGAGDDDIANLAAAVATAVRVNSAGALFGLHAIAVHQDIAERVIEAVTEQVRTVRPAPLPVELQRRRTMSRVHRLAAAGGRVLCGGVVRDDIAHRMGWLVSPTVIELGPAARAVPLLDAVGEPSGPVLTISTWATHSDLERLFTHARHRDGYGSIWGDDVGHNTAAFGAVVRGQGPLAAARAGLVPRGWYEGTGMQGTTTGTTR